MRKLDSEFTMTVLVVIIFNVSHKIMRCSSMITQRGSMTYPIRNWELASQWASCKTQGNRWEVTTDCGHIKQRPYTNSEIFHLKTQ